VPYLGLAVGVAVGVAAGVVAGVVAGVAGASVGSPVAAGVLVVPPPPSPPPSQAPSIAARLNIRAKPKIFVFITPLSPIVARKIFCLLNTIPYLLLFFKCCKITYLKKTTLWGIVFQISYHTAIRLVFLNSRGKSKALNFFVN
jgi:hypothetical protein